MPPNSSGPPALLLNDSPMRRGGPVGPPPQPVAGSSSPLAVNRSEFEDFANAYRRTHLDVPYRDTPPPLPPRAPPEDSKLDFRKSIKKLMKRPGATPSVTSKNHRKEGIQRTPTMISGYSDISEGAAGLQLERTKTKRPVSVNIDSTLAAQTFGQNPTALAPLDPNLLKPDAGHPATPFHAPTSKTSKSSVPPAPPPVTPTSKTPKSSVPPTPAPVSPTSKAPKTPPVPPPPASASPTSKTPRTPIPQTTPPAAPPLQTKSPKAPVVQPQQPGQSKASVRGHAPQSATPPAAQQAKTPKPPVAQLQAQKSLKVPTPQPGSSPAPKPPSRHKIARNGASENGATAAPRTVIEGAGPLVVTVPVNGNPGKKEPQHLEKRRSGTEERFAADAHCLVVTGSSVGRFLPPHHNPDPILSLRVVPVQERKYHVIMEFEESPEPPKRVTSASGMLVFTPEEVRDSREQLGYFHWIRESHLTPIGMLLRNVEKITEFPYLTYLIVGGSRQEMIQKLNFVGGRPSERRGQLRFLAGYEEPVTVCRPPLTTFPERPASDKTGFVVCLYQVLEFEDSLRFEQNWAMWTGARMIYRTLPDYMGLKRISVHKSVVPTKSVNYVLMCEFSNIMDHLMEACVIIDHLRARCCGYIGIYRVLDSL